MDPPLDVDYVVIGSGFGGAVSALRLAEKGWRVAVLEMGKRWGPEDFARSNWNVRKFLWMPRLLCHGIQQITVLRDVLVLHGAGVGGGSLVYANTLLVPPDRAFDDPRWPGGAGWKERLAPHYETARRMLGATLAPQVFAADELLREAVHAVTGRSPPLERHTVGVYFGEPERTVPDPYFGGEGPDRTGCRLCGECMTGCRYGAKNTLDRNYLHLAERRGAVIHPETRVVDVRPMDGGGYEVHAVRSTRPFARRTSWIRRRSSRLSSMPAAPKPRSFSRQGESPGSWRSQPGTAFSCGRKRRTGGFPHSPGSSPTGGRKSAPRGRIAISGTRATREASFFRWPRRSSSDRSGA